MQAINADSTQDTKLLFFSHQTSVAAQKRTLHSATKTQTKSKNIFAFPKKALYLHHLNGTRTIPREIHRQGFG